MAFSRAPYAWLHKPMARIKRERVEALKVMEGLLVHFVRREKERERKEAVVIADREERREKERSSQVLSAAFRLMEQP